MVNGLSVDVEDWFQVGAFEKVIDKADWSALDDRVERNSDAMLALFAEAGVKATFFTLGWVAAALPRADPPDRRCRARSGQPRLGS